MKICPKCNIHHNKLGVYCSRFCANSRNWNEIDKLKKSLSAKSSNKVKAANKIIRRKRTINPNKYCVKQCIICNAEFTSLISLNRKTCSKKCWKLSLGGHRKLSGIGKSGYYKGMWLNSTYEIAFVYFCLDKNLNITRCKKTYQYICPKTSRIRKYHPDFTINNKNYEIKGYVDEVTISKINSSNNEVKLLTKENLSRIFDYVETKTNLKISELHILYEKAPVV